MADPAVGGTGEGVAGGGAKQEAEPPGEGARHQLGWLYLSCTHSFQKESYKFL